MSDCGTQLLDPPSKQGFKGCTELIESENNHHTMLSISTATNGSWHKHVHDPTFNLIQIPQINEYYIMAILSKYYPRLERKIFLNRQKQHTFYWTQRTHLSYRWETKM